MARLHYILLFAIMAIFIDTASAFSGDATFYSPGLGACGKSSSNSDLIFALPAVMFDPSPGGNPNKNKNCGRKVKVTRGRKSVIVRCVDRCTGCKFGDIDLSPAAFRKLGAFSEGRVNV